MSDYYEDSRTTIAGTCTLWQACSECEPALHWLYLCTYQRFVVGFMNFDLKSDNRICNLVTG